MSRIAHGSVDLWRADGTHLWLTRLGGVETTWSWGACSRNGGIVDDRCASNFRDAFRAAMRECDRLARNERRK